MAIVCTEYLEEHWPLEDEIGIDGYRIDRGVLGDEICIGGNRKKNIGRLSIIITPQLISYVNPARMLIVAVGAEWNRNHCITESFSCTLNSRFLFRPGVTGALPIQA